MKSNQKYDAICKSRLENSFVNKRRYKEEIKLSPIKANEDTISDYKLNLANDILVKHSLGLATLFPDED